MKNFFSLRHVLIPASFPHETFRVDYKVSVGLSHANMPPRVTCKIQLVKDGKILGRVVPEIAPDDMMKVADALKDLKDTACSAAKEPLDKLYSQWLSSDIPRDILKEFP